jgi:hypothetical protein
MRYQEILSELKVTRHWVNNADTPVYTNPDAATLEKLFKKFGAMRGLIVDNSVVWAPAKNITHGDLAKLYGIPVRNHSHLRLFIYSDAGDLRFDWDSDGENIVKSHPVIAKYLKYGADRWRIYEGFLHEGRLYSAITVKEISPKYKSLPILGRGTTSIVLTKSNDTVIMLTRDDIKRDWLVNGTKLAKQIDQYDAYHPKYRELSEKPIYVLEMPRLFPLSTQNKRRVKQLTRMVNEILWKNHNKQYLINVIMKKVEELELETNTKHDLRELVDFLSNYDESQYRWDLGPRNFMQNSDGELVVLDPVVEKDILDIYYNKMKYG